MSSAAWHRALAYALTGEEMALGVQGRPDVAALAGQLREAGWTPDRIREHVDALAAAEAPWPHLIPDALRAGLGAAQLFAALREARTELGVDALRPAAPSGRTALNADERRLLADVPPHHVPH